MKPNFLNVLEMAINQGVRRGYSRAYKHVENPTESVIIENIEEQVMSSIYEWFEFPEKEYKE